MVKPIYKPKEICSSALVLQRTYQYITSQHAQMLVGDPEAHQLCYVSAKQLRNNNETPISINFIRICYIMQNAQPAQTK